MSTYAVNSQSHSRVSGLTEAFRAVGHKIAAVAIAYKHRREINQLACVDGAMLRDLGITAMDIDGALSAPLWRDPSAHLVDAREERRLGIRAAKHDNFTGLHA